MIAKLDFGLVTLTILEDDYRRYISFLVFEFITFFFALKGERLLPLFFFAYERLDGCADLCDLVAGEIDLFGTEAGSTTLLYYCFCLFPYRFLASATYDSDLLKLSLT